MRASAISVLCQLQHADNSIACFIAEWMQINSSACFMAELLQLIAVFASWETCHISAIFACGPVLSLYCVNFNMQTTALLAS